MISWHRYVPIDLVPAYLALGWTVDGRGPMPAPHGLWCVLMDWHGPGEPVEPAK